MDLTNILDLPNIIVDDFSVYQNRYQINCHSTVSEAYCPDCHCITSRTKVYYLRKLQDLPITDHSVYLAIRLRKFVCLNPACSRHVFTERLSFAANNARRTKRLDDFILRTVVDQSSIATATLLGKVGITIEKSAICDLLKKNDLDTHQC